MRLLCVTYRAVNRAHRNQERPQNGQQWKSMQVEQVKEEAVVACGNFLVSYPASHGRLPN